MNEEQRLEIIEKAKEFFKTELFEPYINKGIDKSSSLSAYNVNPFLVKFLAYMLEGNDNAESIAKVLILPRVLGTSINTSFGTKLQKMITVLFEGFGSGVNGIDIEFIDAIDGQKKYCQVKAGPNTINKDDITTISNHFKAAKRLARTNNLNIGIKDLVVGVLYGDETSLSAHYKKLQEDYVVLIGADFWHHLTGDPNFYRELTKAIADVAQEFNGVEKLKAAINDLSEEIKELNI